MTLSADEVVETIDMARGYLADRASPTYADKGVAGDFAAALVQIADRCVVGLACEKHYGAIHGREAEELRAGVEQILRDTSGVSNLYDDEALHVLRETRRKLVALLDRVDARDSLAFREATDPPDIDTDAVGVSTAE